MPHNVDNKHGTHDDCEQLKNMKFSTPFSDTSSSCLFSRFMRGPVFVSNFETREGTIPRSLLSTAIYSIPVFHEYVFCHSIACHDASRQNCHAKFEGVFWQPFLVMSCSDY